MNKIKLILILIFLVGAALRFTDALRPINRASWREADLGAVARNFADESMNPFYPRVDWRGTSPGYVEMEFPLYPYLIAITYKIFGVHDFLGRIWAFIFSLLTLAFFYKLAREYLSDLSLVFAFAFFTFNPLIVEFSTSVQPEGLMILGYMMSVYFFLKWLDADRDKDFRCAAAATALTILAKATAAHIGLFFGILLLQKFGVKIFRQPKVWLFALVSLLPASLWYAHAKGMWKNYGNSLGVSNEYHWIGADFFTNSYFAKGILFSEFTVVWIYFGLAVGAFAVFKSFHETTVRRCLLWLASAFAMYLMAARTAADDWASYYHIFSVPPAALLFGIGVGKFSESFAGLINFYGDLSGFEKAKRSFSVATIAVAVIATFALEARQLRADLLEQRTADESYLCAARIKPALKTEGSILVSGGHCFDADGYPLAYNASFMLYWLERKGFNICVEEHSMAKVKEFAAAGAKYFIAQKSIIDQNPDFAAELKRAFPTVDECDEFVIFDLEEILAAD